MPRASHRLAPAVLAVVALLGVTGLHAGAARATTRPAAYLFGDSLSSQSEAYLAPLAARYALHEVAFPGIAPCDWLAEAPLAALRATRPVLAVVETAGINAHTACMKVDGTEPTVGTPAFTSRYETALTTLFSRLVAANPAVRIEYVGSPPMRDEAFNKEGVALLWWAHEARRSFPQLHVAYGPRRALADEAGQFTARLPCLATETAAMGCASGWIRVRAADGVHFYCARLTLTFGCFDYDAGAYRWAAAVDRLAGRGAPGAAGRRRGAVSGVAR